MRSAVLLALFLALTGCGKPSEPTKSQANETPKPMPGPKPGGSGDETRGTAK